MYVKLAKKKAAIHHLVHLFLGDAYAYECRNVTAPHLSNRSQEEFIIWDTINCFGAPSIISDMQKEVVRQIAVEILPVHMQDIHSVESGLYI